MIPWRIIGILAALAAILLAIMMLYVAGVPE